MDLGDKFKTFDRYDVETRHAVSIKTLDTNAKTYVNRPSEITHRLNRYTNDVINFGEGSGNIRLKNNMINTKTILLGIPQNTTLAQLVAIDRAIDYAKLNGINFIIKPIK